MVKHNAGGVPQRGWWGLLASLPMWHRRYVSDLKRLVEDLLPPSSPFLLPDTEKNWLVNSPGHVTVRCRSLPGAF